MPSLSATEELTLIHTEVRRLASSHPKQAKQMLQVLRLLSPKLHQLFTHYLKGIEL